MMGERKEVHVCDDKLCRDEEEVVIRGIRDKIIEASSVNSHTLVDSSYKKGIVDYVKEKYAETKKEGGNIQLRIVNVLQNVSDGITRERKTRKYSILRLQKELQKAKRECKSGNVHSVQESNKRQLHSQILRKRIFSKVQKNGLSR